MAEFSSGKSRLKFFLWWEIFKKWLYLIPDHWFVQYFHLSWYNLAMCLCPRICLFLLVHQICWCIAVHKNLMIIMWYKLQCVFVSDFSVAFFPFSCSPVKIDQFYLAFPCTSSLLHWSFAQLKYLFQLFLLCFLNFFLCCVSFRFYYGFSGLLRCSYKFISSFLGVGINWHKLPC